jgi:hypothetical protein
MRELAFPAWMRWRFWWALLLGAFLLALGLTDREPWVLLMGGLLLLAFALHLRRTGLPGWDQALAHLGVDWRGVEGLEDYLLGQRGRVWFLGALYPPREAEGVHRWALGLYRRHFLKIYGALALAGVGLPLLSLAEGLGVALFALGLGLAFWWFSSFPHDLVRLRGGGGRYNPLDPEIQRLAKEGRG